MESGQWNWTPIAVAAGIALVVAVAGGVLTTIGPWYQSLRRPDWKPPDWAFGPIWTTIFTLAAISAVLAWNADASPERRSALLVAYAVNAVLNIAWSAIFFRMRRPDWALAEVVLLWLSILALILVTLRVSTLGAVLLLPYLAWVGIAAVLNRAIVRLNGPFGAA
ncbi:TspO protein [Methylobacterium sp. Leaf469]|jgi:tryptophan-rich sensory protein|uniref:TspO/MBR family protein n=1 Tax=unclassified Methylobacterium TaxID=2615210 RepID=UPI0006F2AFF0|nr:MULTISPECIES: TspO/MBR family protein [unclassified Methylobacterium]USU31272.1 tryptophan-rich sensory protein [Methylobacterium sp. OTU13CASTA1]KQO56769.1 TspO protein [Methylobacterium sp. Leaf87]KQP18675.1 TspO protein [Methylobacterium sp. Leaf100]KQP24035.1 TspO protein [Methylobacterium sp. Leaf102]KQP68130.1 TspO protein [Methylobacterium sp. Leaf112]